jgi:hypothetical protein
MRGLRLLIIGSVTLVLGAVLAGGASAKQPGLVLKEAGVTLADHVELAIELETSLVPGCRLYNARAGLYGNGTRRPELGVAFGSEESCRPPNDYFEGEVFAVSLTNAGKGKLRTDLLVETEHMPGLRCMYRLTRFSGTFSIPGAAVIEGSAVGKLRTKESATGCAESASTHFTLTVIGHNNKPLETELIG